MSKSQFETPWDAAWKLEQIGNRICGELENIQNNGNLLTELLTLLRTTPKRVTYSREFKKIAEAVRCGEYLKASTALEHFHSVVPDAELKQVLDWVNAQK
jgi:type II secretory pathway component PulF